MQRIVPRTAFLGSYNAESLCTSLYIAQRQAFLAKNLQLNLQHGYCKLMKHRLLSIGNL